MLVRPIDENGPIESEYEKKIRKQEKKNTEQKISRVSYSENRIYDEKSLVELATKCKHPVVIKDLNQNIYVVKTGEGKNDFQLKGSLRDLIIFFEKSIELAKARSKIEEITPQV